MIIFNSTKFKRIIAIFLVLAVLFTGIGPSFTMSVAYAGSSDPDDGSGGMLGWIISKLTSWISGIVQGLLDKCFKIPDTEPSLFITQIVYGKVEAFDINIFRATTLTGSNRDKAALNDDTIATIAKYYGFCRTLAIAASLVILIYVGIRIVISTSAGDLTKYKSLLKDWLLSLALVLMMHYIMSLVLYTCDALTNMFASMSSGAITLGPSATGSAVSQDFYQYIDSQIDTNAKNSIIYSVIKLSFLGTTIAFIFIYAKRTLMMAFLTIVAPLVGMSYTIDKIKDGQSQILDKWLKEYIYTALIMPLDALLFSIVSGMMWTLLSSTDPNIILVLALLFGYLPLRGWFTEFIGADKTSHAMAGVAAGAMAGKALSDYGANKRKGNNESSDSKKLPGGSNGGDPTGSSGAQGLSGTSGAQLGSSVGGGTNSISAGTSPSAGNGAVASPSSYASGLTRPPQLGGRVKGASLKDELKQKTKQGAINLGKKAGRGAINMGENAVARGAGLLAGGLKAAALMSITGNAGTALTAGASGYKKTTNSMVSKMDDFETKATNARSFIQGNDDARNALMHNSENEIMDNYNSNMQQSIDDMDNLDSGYQNAMQRFNNYSNMSADEFNALSYDEKEQIMSDVRDTIGEKEFNNQMNDPYINESDAQLALFTAAQGDNFRGARMKQKQSYREGKSNIAERRAKLTKQKDNDLIANREKYKNASRTAIGAEYRGAGQDVHNEKARLRDERKAETRSQKKKQ